MLKEKIKESENSLGQKQAKWRNIFFDKNGASYYGTILWDKISESEAAVQRGFKKDGWKTADWELKKSNYSWHMQIPSVTE